MAVPLILVLAAPLFGLAQPGSTSRLDPKPPPKLPPGLPLNPYKTVHGGQTVGDPNVGSCYPVFNFKPGRELGRTVDGAKCRPTFLLGHRTKSLSGPPRLPPPSLFKYRELALTPPQLPHTAAASRTRRTR